MGWEVGDVRVAPMSFYLILSLPAPSRLLCAKERRACSLARCAAAVRCFGWGGRAFPRRSAKRPAIVSAVTQGTKLQAGALALCINYFHSRLIAFAGHPLNHKSGIGSMYKL